MKAPDRHYSCSYLVGEYRSLVSSLDRRGLSTCYPSTVSVRIYAILNLHAFTRISRIFSTHSTHHRVVTIFSRRSNYPLFTRTSIEHRPKAQRLRPTYRLHHRVLWGISHPQVNLVEAG